MLPVKTVELTKVHYFEPNKFHRNVSVIPTISREVSENVFNKNVLIKKNIFGARWVLKINEENRGDKTKKRRKLKLFLYSSVFACLLIAISGAVFFAFDLEKKLSSFCVFHKNPRNITDRNQLLKIENQTFFNNSESPSYNSSNGSNKPYCVKCTSEEVCLKIEETEKPKCVGKVDKNDPTGCGGICLLNTEFCEILDKKHEIFQCSPLKNLLKCPKDYFNCGEQCILKNKVCDGIIHCKDMQDEKNCDCNSNEHFRCNTSSVCLPNTKKCDGIIDCWDKSDETECHKGCLTTQFTCLNGQCILLEKFCDGIPHCLDKSDEPNGCQ